MLVYMGSELMLWVATVYNVVAIMSMAIPYTERGRVWSCCNQVVPTAET